MIKNNYDNLVKDLVGQIITSGKSFNDIDRNLLYSVLRESKVPSHFQDALIKAIGHEYARVINEKNEKSKSQSINKNPDVEIKSSHKVRAPRKTVFSDINKIN